MDQQSFDERQSRRRFLTKVGAWTGTGLAIGAGAFTIADRVFASAPANPINHLLIACQENRSFDEYFGYYPKAGAFGIPQGYSQPDGQGGTVQPYRWHTSFSANVSHKWHDIHNEWHNGAMDGFYTTDGDDALGYYDGSKLQYYYSLANQFTLCGNYFAYQLGPTAPNRLALCSGTCGGNTTDTVDGQLDWPTIADLLDAHHISWKCYNLGLGTGSLHGIGEIFNGLSYFKQWQSDQRLYYKEDDYHHDLQHGTLPQVSFLITEALISEHPPTDIQWGQNKMQDVITALMQSSAWQSAALFLTYDEGGGYFDHVSPPQVDAYGMGMRVPTLVISPYAKRGYVSGQLYEHSSILKFIERRFALPSLASINHQFDMRTPGLSNDAANGKAYGPPAPPRDGLAQLGDFYEVFNF